MFFKKSNEDLTQKLTTLFSQEPNDKTDKDIFILASKIVTENANNYIAIYILAQCYHHAIGTNKDCTKATELYEKLLDIQEFNSDDVDFQYKFADALNNINNNRCLLWYQKAASQGDQWSTYLLGSLLLKENYLPDIPYESRYSLAIVFLNKAIKIGTENEISQLAKDTMNVEEAKHKIKNLEIKKQNMIFDILTSQ